SLTNLNQPDTSVISRVIQGIIAGVGFLGGGAILKSSDDMVRGLTTAASIWLVASLGIACGAGQFGAALIALAIALIVLVFGNLRVINGDRNDLEPCRSHVCRHIMRGLIGMRLRFDP